MSWIKCSERMPEDGNKVLVYAPPQGPAESARNAVGVYEKAWGWTTFDDTTAYCGISHWQPPPEPPND